MTNWISIGTEYPPYDKPVLVTDGEYCQIRILRLKEGIKMWESLSTNNMTYSASHWMLLPRLPGSKEEQELEYFKLLQEYK